MGVPFDHIASAHDSIYTKSAIGQLQRKTVWKYIEKIIPELPGFEMLELNTGAGDDALLFGERGFNIVATDISHEMLKVTFKKTEQFSLQNRISSQYLDLESLDETVFDKKFDLIFSNFGGLNGINPESLKTLLSKIPAILNPGGRFIGIVMPKFCAWETAFFLSKLRFKKAFRRLTSKEVLNSFHGTNLRTWYYSPSQIRKWSKKKFKIVSIRPVGFALPSSYLESFFSFKKRVLLKLNKIDKRFNQSSFFACMSDHFVIDLQMK